MPCTTGDLLTSCLFSRAPFSDWFTLTLMLFLLDDAFREVRLSLPNSFVEGFSDAFNRDCRVSMYASTS